MTEDRAHTVTRLDSIAEMLRRTQIAAKVMWDRACPADRERFGADYDALVNLDGLAERLIEHGDLIQIEVDATPEIEADSQRDAA